MERDRFEVERLDEAFGRGAGRRREPGHDVRETLVIAQRLAVVGLILDPEVAATRLLTREGVAAHELGQLEEVRHPAGALQLLVHLARTARHREVLPEGVTQARHLVDGLLETRSAALETARLPHEAP